MQQVYDTNDEHVAVNNRQPANNIQVISHQGSLLLTWFNFNPSMNK